MLRYEHNPMNVKSLASDNISRLGLASIAISLFLDTQLSPYKSSLPNDTTVTTHYPRPLPLTPHETHAHHSFPLIHNTP